MGKNMEKLIFTIYLTLSVVNLGYSLYYLTIPYLIELNFINKIFTIFFMICFSFLFGPFIVFNWAQKKWIDQTVNKFEKAYYGENK